MANINLPTENVGQKSANVNEEDLQSLLDLMLLTNPATASAQYATKSGKGLKGLGKGVGKAIGEGELLGLLSQLSQGTGVGADALKGLERMGRSKKQFPKGAHSNIDSLINYNDMENFNTTRMKEMLNFSNPNRDFFELMRMQTPLISKEEQEAISQGDATIFDATERGTFDPRQQRTSGELPSKYLDKLLELILPNAPHLVESREGNLDPKVKSIVEEHVNSLTNKNNHLTR